VASREEIKKELTALIQRGAEIARNYSKPDPKRPDSHLEYQKWYSQALPLVRALAADRYEEFRRYYEPDPKRKSLGYGTYVIQDFIKGVVPSELRYPDFDSRSQMIGAVLNQVTIVAAVADRLDSLLSDLESVLFTDLKDAELSTAAALLKISPRAAGALAGVVLEAFLQRVADRDGVKIAKKNPTVSDLNERLKQARVYDVATWRKIGYLADIRNLCSHSKSIDPTPAQVAELIEGVNWAIKNVP